MHQDFHMGSKSRARPGGGGLRWHIPSLRELTATSSARPAFAFPRDSGNQISRSSRLALKRHLQISRARRISSMGPVKERIEIKRSLKYDKAKGDLVRNRRPSSTSQEPSAIVVKRVFRKRLKRGRHGRRPGASEDTPICIDSDEEMAEGDNGSNTRMWVLRILTL
jgi:hypothetical protein